MTATEVETEIRAAIAEMTAAMQDADAATLDRLMSNRPGCVHIGTDSGEWFDKAQILAGLREALKDEGGPIRIEQDDLFVHAQGDVAWIEGTIRFVARDGTECPARVTGVLVRENGAWKSVQSHASIGVPNADMFRH